MLTICSVYTYQVDVVEGSAKREFTAETDMPWLDFRRRAVGLLEYNEIELVYKVTGDSGRPSHLKTEADFNSAMARVCQKALSARSRPVGLEIRNTVSICHSILNHDTVSLRLAHIVFLSGKRSIEEGTTSKAETR